MDLQKTIRDAIIAELERQAEAGDPAPQVGTREPGHAGVRGRGDLGYAVIEGGIALDALIMVIEGALAGGPGGVGTRRGAALNLPHQPLSTRGRRMRIPEPFPPDRFGCSGVAPTRDLILSGVAP